MPQPLSSPTPAPILVVDNCIALTGALKAILSSLEHIRQEFPGLFTFEFVLPTGSAALPDIAAQGYTVHTLPFVEISKRPASLLQYPFALLRNGWRLRQLARQRRARLVHMNDFFNLAGLVAKGVGGTPVLTHVRLLPHNFPSPLRNLWVGADTAWADRVICVSEAVRSAFPDKANVQVIADPLPTTERHPQPLPNAVGRAGQGQIQLLYLANYIPGKGQDHALAAFRVAYQQNPALRLSFYGGDMGLEKNREYKQQLQAEAQQAGLTEVVHFGEFITDVEQQIKQADVVLNFSETESFSLTCLDALYYGTALIASDCGGPRELFEHGRSGWLVPNKDRAAMAQAITAVAADADMRATFARNGREFVRHKFRPDQTYRKLKDVYLELLAV